MGLTSRAGVIPLSYLADIAGPMARTVEDAVAVFQVDRRRRSGRSGDGAQPRPRDSELRARRSSRDGLKGARIGILRQAYERADQRAGTQPRSCDRVVHRSWRFDD